MRFSLLPFRLEERTKTDNYLIKTIHDVISLSDTHKSIIGVIDIKGALSEFSLDTTDIYLYIEEYEIRIRKV